MTELICIGCPKGCHLLVDETNAYQVTGNGCLVGAKYGKQELQNPTRVLTTTVQIVDAHHACLPVRTNGAIPKRLMMKAMKLLHDVQVQAPIHEGDIIVKNLLDTGVDVIACRDM